MEPVLFIFAAAGLFALVGRLFRSLLRLGLAAAEATAVAGQIDASVRRGDLTAMAEGREQERGVRRTRLLAGLLALLWVALLVVPPVLGWGREGYAAAAILWLLPRQHIRPRIAPAEA